MAAASWLASSSVMSLLRSKEWPSKGLLIVHAWQSSFQPFRIFFALLPYAATSSLRRAGMRAWPSKGTSDTQNMIHDTRPTRLTQRYPLFPSQGAEFVVVYFFRSGYVRRMYHVSHALSSGLGPSKASYLRNPLG